MKLLHSMILKGAKYTFFEVPAQLTICEAWVMFWRGVAITIKWDKIKEVLLICFILISGVAAILALVILGSIVYVVTSPYLPDHGGLEYPVIALAGIGVVYGVRYMCMRVSDWCYSVGRVIEVRRDGDS